MCEVRLSFRVARDKIPRAGQLVVTVLPKRVLRWVGLAGACCARTRRTAPAQVLVATLPTEERVRGVAAAVVNPGELPVFVLLTRLTYRLTLKTAAFVISSE